MASSIILGGGCFWCIEAAYQQVKGVESVRPGYAGGDTEDPDYRSVSTGKTGHAEVVKVTFDEQIISLAQILQVFWLVHDPTTPDRQGADVGSQYRSFIGYSDDAQKAAVEESLDAAQANFDDPIVTELARVDNFYPAEDEHVNFYAKQPEAPYCQVVINPKLAKLRQSLDHLLV